jgi:hypothetical protein
MGVAREREPQRMLQPAAGCENRDALLEKGIERQVLR